MPQDPNTYSLQHLLEYIPIFLAMLFLLYYAHTFHRPSAHLSYRMAQTSWYHETILLINMLSLLRSAVQLGFVLCCVSPHLCVADGGRHQPSKLFECPAKLKAEELLRYEAFQFMSSVLVVSAMLSLKFGHILQDLETRVHHATLTPFDPVTRLRYSY
uniref:AlNc14C439G11646 protein n=1 Tax=Albugo laibachii Nc14 TaxID=890382 RepID=F0WZQ5_9STRA|nr:AlNc14C439G11646 [Albugo laibachii Nc14]|eukprot:CCA26982.1 AlNc14C439G11646 [Albugo laibachii Nc14]